MSRTAEIRALAYADPAAATVALAALLRDRFGMVAQDVRINLDKYSLNSLNGFFTHQGTAFFFKFHQEEGEEAMTGEYYRAGLLAEVGLPVDLPVRMSAEPGEQILIYRRRDDPRFSDVLHALDRADDPAARALAVRAEQPLAADLLRVTRATLHPITAAEAAAEPIHRLFHERLIDSRTRAYPGGRLASFYLGQTVRFPGLDLAWEEFARLRFVINGRPYARPVGALFDAAADRLRPDRLADAGGVTAHGDAHNANVWYAAGETGPRLIFFDPAFAGRHVPTLLAEVKATFHNVFAHPFWLYDPAEATAAFRATARRDGTDLHVETDWDLTPIRRDLLAVKADQFWRPLLAELKARDLLPADWREVLRLALFLCPTLVMNLRAGAQAHTPTSSLIAFSVAVMAGSAPLQGRDRVTAFLDAIAPD